MTLASSCLRLAAVAALGALAACSSTSGGPTRNLGVAPGPGGSTGSDGTIPSSRSSLNGLVTRYTETDDGVEKADSTGATSFERTVAGDGSIGLRANSAFGSGRPVPSIVNASPVAGEPGVYRTSAGDAVVGEYQEGDFYFVEALRADGSGSLDQSIGYRVDGKTDPVALGAQRSASYAGTGRIAISDVAADGLVDRRTHDGNATLQADFAAGTVEGRIVSQASDGSITAVSLDRGKISGSDFYGDSTLTTSSGPIVSDQSGNYVGSFTGARGQSAGGVASGTASVEAGDETILQNYSAMFVAGRR